MQCLLIAQANSILPRPFSLSGPLYHPSPISTGKGSHPLHPSSLTPPKVAASCCGMCQGLEVSVLTGSLCVSLAGVTNGFGKHTESGSDSECSLGLSGGLAFEACR